MDIATDMDALRKNATNFNTLAESLLARLLIKRARLIELRDKRMVFYTHVQIKDLDRNIQNIQNIINGKCGF